MCKKFVPCRILFICFLVSAAVCGCGRSGGDEFDLEDIAGTGQIQEGRGDVLAAHETEGSASEGERAEKAEQIYVFVCGAVKRPGVVALPGGSRAQDGVLAAGGMREDADPNYVNLAALLSDGEKLYIPTREESADLQKEEEQSGLVNINTAGSAELCTLPGIGESRAADIISYREANGRFGAIEDIMKVNGIKESVFSKIKELITV